jgi:hypothetical protein
VGRLSRTRLHGRVSVVIAHVDDSHAGTPKDVYLCQFGDVHLGIVFGTHGDVLQRAAIRKPWVRLAASQL